MRGYDRPQTTMLTLVNPGKRVPATPPFRSDRMFCICIVERGSAVEEEAEDAGIRSATDDDADFGKPREAGTGQPSDQADQAAGRSGAQRALAVVRAEVQ